MTRPWLAILMSFVTSACGGGSRIEVVDAWARPTPPVAEAAAFYVTVDNHGDRDVLLSASSDRCEVTELHDHVLEDNILMMREVGPLEVQGQESLVMEPAGLHIMCLGVAEELVVGEEVTVLLGFEEAGEIEVAVIVEQR